MGASRSISHGVQEKVMTDPTTLKVFDFDWVLLKTPCPKQGVRWWEDRRSLQPPYVPVKVPRALWINTSVLLARTAVKDPETVTAVITGRGVEFHQRIKQILHQMGIRPDFIETRPLEWEATVVDVLEFKCAAIQDLLDRFPSIYNVEVWEDQEEQLREIKKDMQSLGIRFTPHLVTERHDSGIAWSC